MIFFIFVFLPSYSFLYHHNHPYRRRHHHHDRDRGLLVYTSSRGRELISSVCRRQLYGRTWLLLIPPPFPYLPTPLHPLIQTPTPQHTQALIPYQLPSPSATTTIHSKPSPSQPSPNTLFSSLLFSVL